MTKIYCDTCNREIIYTDNWDGTMLSLPRPGDVHLNLRLNTHEDICQGCILDAIINTFSFIVPTHCSTACKSQSTPLQFQNDSGEIMEALVSTN